MATYKINAKYEYEAEIEAGSPDEAERIFLDDLNMYYVGTYDFECEKLEEEEEEEEELEEEEEELEEEEEEVA